MRMIFPYFATIAAITLTAQAAFAGGLFPSVVVTVAPLKPYVDEILMGYGQSQNLLRPGQEPHSFALAPSQAEMLDKADIIITPDLGMNPFLKRLLESKSKALVIELSSLEGADPLPYARENPWLSAMKEAQKPVKPQKKPKAKSGSEAPKEVAGPVLGLMDPHLWLDPERMATIALPLATAMSARMPEEKQGLTANANALARHLHNEVMPPLRVMLKIPARTTDAVGKQQLPFVTYHAAYQYFLQRFGLAHYGEIVTRPEDIVGAKTAMTLINGAKNYRVRCVIGEQESMLMQRIAKATDAKIILLSPEQLVEKNKVDPLDWIKNDYDGFIYVTAKAFSGCL